MEDPPFSAPAVVFDVSKLAAAAFQIKAAIHALSMGNVISAITLAGAAEGMLPEPDQTSAFRGLRDHPAVPPGIRPDWVTIINMDRDWLKHPTPHLPDRLKMQTDDGAFMIVRALSKLPAEHWTPGFEAFKVWYLAWAETRPRLARFPERPG